MTLPTQYDPQEVRHGLVNFLANKLGVLPKVEVSTRGETWVASIQVPKKSVDDRASLEEKLLWLMPDGWELELDLK